MQQGYFVRQGDTDKLPQDFTQVTDSLDRAKQLVQRELEAGREASVELFIGAFYCQLASNTARQDKGYDYGDRYGCKPSDRALNYRNRVRNG